MGEFSFVWPPYTFHVGKRNMMNKNQISLLCCLLLVLATKRGFCALNEQITSSLSNQTATPFIPYRYIREVFFFLSENATVATFKGILDKLFELDEFCGGENIYTSAYCNVQNPISCPILCSLRNVFSLWYNKADTALQNCRAHHTDLSSDLRELLFKLSDMMNNGELQFRGSPPFTNFMTQVIFITDYTADSFESGDNVFKNIKSQLNVTFIALITNLTN
jgi:hypothetical protein